MSEDYAEVDEKCLASYMIGLISFLWVNKRDFNSFEYYKDMCKYFEFIEKELMDESDAEITIRKILGELWYTDKHNLWKERFSSLFSTIYGCHYPKDDGDMTIFVEEINFKEYEPILNSELTKEEVLSFFIGLSHWVLTDKIYWKSVDPQQQFLECLRKEIAPEMEMDRLLEMLFILDYEPRYEDIRFRAYELIGIHEIIMQIQDPNEPDIDEEMYNFQLKFR